MTYSTKKPIIIRFQDPMDPLDPTVPTWPTNKYYFYKLVRNSVNSLYTGRSIIRTVEGRPTAEMNIAPVIDCFAYDGEGTLKPVYDNANQVYSLPFRSLYTQAQNPIITEWDVELYEDIEDPYVDIQNVIATSAYDTIQPVKNQAEVTGFQNLLECRTSLLPHYPWVDTANYGPMFLMNFAPSLVDENMHIVDNEISPAIDLALYTPGHSEMTVGYAVPMTSVIHADSSTTVLYGGDAETNFSDIVYNGDAESTYNDNIYGGNAEPWPGGSTVTKPAFLYFTRTVGQNVYTEPVAEIDACSSDYYLAWMTHSGAPFSYGFDGLCLDSATVDKVLTTDYYYFEHKQTSDTTKSWEINSGIVTAEMYDLFMDIYDSKWICLYDVKQDKVHYCTCTDDSWNQKNIWKDRTPRSLTLHLKECEYIHNA